MAFTLENLLPADQQLRIVQPHEPVSHAIDLMCQHGYGQLPVSGANGNFLGQVITFESVIQAIQSFQTKPELLLIRDAAQRVRSYPADADLLATLDDIHRDNFALIVDDSKLRGIVTTADAAVFFREYAQDLMLIESIESRIKDAIQALYAGDVVRLEAAIARVTDRGADIRRKLPKAIRAFLAKVDTPLRGELDPGALAEAEKKLDLPEPTGEFEKLSLNELIEVLLIHDCAPRLSQSQNVSELRELLQRVRNARNKLAHFRDDLSFEERRTIKFAAEWLENNLPLPPPDVPSPQPTPLATRLTSPPSEVMEEETEGPTGSYSLLAAHLEIVPTDVGSVTLTFDQIEQILKKELPRSASEYRAWWSNDPTKPQSAAWLDEGWRTTSVNMTERRLTFVRTNDRKEAYIRFFAKLSTRLKSERDFPLRHSSPQGMNWHVLASLDKGDAASVIASFTRRKLFRIEVFIDFGGRDENKRCFDQLFTHRDELEHVVGEPMEWERMDHRRASRIAIYTKAQISTDADNPVLLDWAVKRANDLYRTFKLHFMDPSLAAT
ncbi:MAG: hypothetical protein JWQ49_5277 [Edaphobacter sp.]|nr:hypothetical protein [Edaphobacter sp.]